MGSSFYNTLVKLSSLDTKNLCYKMSDNEDMKTLPPGLYTEKPKIKKSKSKAKQTEKMDLGAVPPHIMRIVQGVEEKRKNKNEDEKKRQQSDDSITILRKMMGSVRTKCDLDTAGDEARVDKETDIAKIANARDIFKHLEANPDGENQREREQEKHKRVEVNVDFMLEGQNKAEEIRKARLKEMASMKSAREQTLEDEEMWNKRNKEKSDEIKRQRETELMKAARQQAIEEEERLDQVTRVDQRRNISPGLEAAKNISFNRNLVDEGTSKIEQMRMERLREIEEMKRAREEMVDEDFSRDEKSEAARELEVFRSSRSSGSVSERYKPADEMETERSRSQAFAKAPKSKAKSNNWMVNSSQDKLEEARLVREREIEMMMVARSQAIEEEEEERVMLEAERRLEAERKGAEMAVLVADLQRMRATTARDAEEEAQMSRYQEEMLSRVMELHDIARGAMVENN